ncbi:MAG: VOC family protein [Clostridia bacterium]|nr:VOC family protein [Clostridia bacterium]
MKFLWTTIHVKNLDESIAFYSDLLGLKMMRRFPAGPEMEIAFMGNEAEGETLVEFIEDKSNRDVTFGEFISLGFAVDSVDEMLNTVKEKSIPVHSGPFDVPGSRYFCIKDPNGLILQLFQQR